MYAWLEERCSALPGFKIERSLVLATFSAGSGAVLADLDAAVPAIATHPLLSAATAAAAPVTVVLPDGAAGDGDAPSADLTVAGRPAGDDGSPGGASPSPAARSAQPATGTGAAAGDHAAAMPSLKAGESRRLAVVGRLGPRGATVRQVRPPVEVDPRDELLVLDLDPAQQAAVAAAMRGDDVVIEGPPGTGTTHTLAATVAALAAAGRRVLVVGPRRASVDALLVAARRGRHLRPRARPAGRRRRPGGDRGDVDDGRDPHRAAVGAAASDDAAAHGCAARPAARRPGRPAGRERCCGATEGGRARQPDPVHSISSVQPAPGVTADGACVSRRRCCVPRAGCSTARWRHCTSRGTRGWSRPTTRWSRSRSSAGGRRRRAPASGCRTTSCTQLDAVTRERLRVHLHAAAAAGAFTLSRVDTRWYDAAVTTEEEAQAALDAALTLRANLERARGAMDAVTADAGLQRAQHAAGWLPLLDVLLRVRATVDVMTPAVYEAPLDELVQRDRAALDARQRRPHPPRAAPAAAAGAGAGAARRPPRGPARRPACGAQNQLARWEELSADGEGPRVVVGLSDAAASVSRVTQALDVLAAVFEGTDTPDPRYMPLDDLERRVFDLAGDAKSILGQPRRATLISGLHAGRAGRAGRRPARSQGGAGRHRRRAGPGVVDVGAGVGDPLGPAAGAALRGRASRQASAELRASETAYIYAGAGRVRDGGAGAGRRRCWRRARTRCGCCGRSCTGTTGRRGLPDLVRGAGDVLAALCPVWVMSPDTVASCLPPASVGTEPPVDVVVVDDAITWRCRRWWRRCRAGRQVVVAGDRRRRRRRWTARR